MSSTEDPPGDGPDASSAPSRRRTRAGAQTTTSGGAATAGGGRGGKRAQKGIIAPGVVLNGIYEVRRLIARGGMGEVYEGVNVNADERVAIKVILPHLAADPNVQTMFRKEARTLTSFAHPALVQYRVLAREPRRDLLYIVTDFIDGKPLLDLVGKMRPTPRQLAMLTRRLAEGLSAAHGHGAIHRDISPENILLPDGDLARAKIIDFGIAKSMETGAQTVVGDGFAGKLGYVAPEQFGDFNRNVGAWTDIYSLALVILGLAAGKAPDMGTTLVEAIDRRRAGPDIAALPPSLAPIFAWMLSADPKDRPQSMIEVIQALDKIDLPEDSPEDIAAAPGANAEASSTATVIGDPQTLAAWRSILPGGSLTSPPPEPGPEPEPPAAPAVDPTVFVPTGAFSLPPTAPESVADAPVPPPAAPEPVAALKAEAKPKPAPKAKATQSQVKAAVPPPPKPPEPAADAGGKRAGPPMALIGGGLAAIVVVVLAVMLWPKPKPTGDAAGGQVVATAAPLASLTGALTGTPCAWLSASSADGGRVRVDGVAADPTAVNAAAAAALQGSGQAGADLDTSGVLRAASSVCPVLDAAAPLHKPVADNLGLTVQQASFEVESEVAGCPAGQPTAQAIATLNVDPAKGFALIGIEPSGQLRQIATSREQFLQFARRYPNAFTDLGGGRYRLAMCQGDLGVAGLLAIAGDGPFDLGLRQATAVRPPATLAARLREGAAKGWTGQVAWFRIVDTRPNRPGAPVVATLDGVQIVEGQPLPQTPGAEAPVTPVEPPPAVTPAPAPVTRAAADWQACRRFRGGAWEEMGFGNQAECIQRVFAGQCDVQSGRFGETDMRRYNGQIQAGSGGRFSRRWASIGVSDCPK